MCKKYHETLWLTPSLPHVSFGDTFAKPIVTYYYNGPFLVMAVLEIATNSNLTWRITSSYLTATPTLSLPKSKPNPAEGHIYPTPYPDMF